MSQYVHVIAPAWQTYPVLIPSLICQTHRDWALTIIHDGPNQEFRDLVASFKEPRVTYVETAERYDDHGHTLRKLGFAMIPPNADYVMVSNHDNYHAPLCLQFMLDAFQPGDVAVYCDMVHNYWGYQPRTAELIHSGIDHACLLWRRKDVDLIGWPATDYCADWAQVKAGIEKFGEHRFRHVPRTLLVHN